MKGGKARSFDNSKQYAWAFVEGTRCCLLQMGCAQLDAQHERKRNLGSIHLNMPSDAVPRPR